MRARAVLAAALLAALLPPPGRAGPAEPALGVCLDEALPPYSFHRGDASGGFDLAVAAALARRLGRPLEVQWYESKLDMDASSALAANALLSDGRCALVAGYPLVRDGLGKPGAETARLPGFEGAKPADRLRRVALGALAPSRPYHRALLAIVLAATVPARNVLRLADLEGLKLATESGTLSDAILMSFADGRFVDRITHVVPGRGELLARLEHGDDDAALVPLHRFDLYRAEHPGTGLKVGGYYDRIGFNMGFVALSSDAALLDRVNGAISAMLAAGELPELARAAGMTYVPPQPPDVFEGVSMRDLGGD